MSNQIGYGVYVVETSTSALIGYGVYTVETTGASSSPSNIIAMNETTSIRKQSILASY